MPKKITELKNKVIRPYAKPGFDLVAANKQLDEICRGLGECADLAEYEVKVMKTTS